MTKHSAGPVRHWSPPDAIDWLENGGTSPAVEAAIEQVRRAFSADRLVLLIGSGVSRYAPSDAPMAIDLASELRACLQAGLEGPLAGLFGRAAGEVPFEVLMARLNELSSPRAREAADALTRVQRPNLLHRQVAKLVRQAQLLGRRLTVVTTNYDRGIELALEESPGDLIVPVASIPSAEQANAPVLILHVHGLLGEPESLVLDYKEEFSLPKWKRSLLRSRLEGSTLLVLGFSGWDLDVSAALTQCGVQQLLWVRRDSSECEPDAWSLDSRRACQAVPNVSALNVSDRLECVLDPSRVKTDPPLPEPTRGDLKARVIPAVERLGRDGPWLTLWAKWTALRAGVAAAADSLTAAELALIPEWQRLELRSFGHYYAGRCRTGAEMQLRAADLCQGDTGIRLYLLNNAAEFLARGGYSLGAWSVIRRVEKEAQQLRDGSPLSDGEESELANLQATLLTLWPFGAWVAFGGWVPKRIRQFIQSQTEKIHGRDLDKHLILTLINAASDSDEYRAAEARYRCWGSADGRSIPCAFERTWP